MRQRRFSQLFVMIVVLLVTSLGICTEIRAQEPIKIGAIFDLTGFLSPLGPDCKKAAILAFEQIGYKVAGKPIEFIFEDGASDPATVMDKARKLAEVDKVNLIIGPVHAGAAMGMASYLDKVKVPNLAIAPHTDVEPLKHGWMFEVCGTLRQATYGTGIYAYDKLGYRTATTLAQDYVAGHEFIAGFVQAFEEKGGKIVQEQWYPNGTTDFTSYFIAMKKADCLAAWWPGADAFAAFHQYRETGLQVPIIQPEDGGITTSPPALKNLGQSAEGTVVTAIYTYTADTPGNKQFVDAYRKRWDGELPAPMAGATYTSVQIALEAIRKLGGNITSQEALRNALTDVSIDTVRGHISFNKDRVAIFTSFVAKINEKLQPIIVGEYKVRADKVGDKMVVKLAD
jgi:branched-chain amino acid transport system substrate-binding protein